MKTPASIGDHSGCISAGELIQYRERKLEGARLEYVRLHLENCLLCLDALLHVGNAGEDEPVEVPSDFMAKLNGIAREARSRASRFFTETGTK